LIKISRRTSNVIRIGPDDGLIASRWKRGSPAFYFLQRRLQFKKVLFGVRAHGTINRAACLEGESKIQYGGDYNV